MKTKILAIFAYLLWGSAFAGAKIGFADIPLIAFVRYALYAGRTSVNTFFDISEDRLDF